MKTSEAADRVPDGSLDYVYVDARYVEKSEKGRKKKQSGDCF